MKQIVKTKFRNFARNCRDPVRKNDGLCRPARPPSRTGGGPPSRSRSRNPSGDTEDDQALKKYHQ
jgi:hypothetical protein